MRRIYLVVVRYVMMATMTINPVNKIIGISANTIISKIGICILFAGALLISGSCTGMKNNVEISKTIVNLPSCDPGDVSAWINQTALRRQELDNDYDQLNASNPDSFDDYIPYANRAEYRYNQQISQSTPSCLSDVQELVAEEAWLFWKMLDEASAGNSYKAQEHGGSLVAIAGRVDEAMILAIEHTQPQINKQNTNSTSGTNRLSDPTQTTSPGEIDQASIPTISSNTTVLFFDDFENEEFTDKFWNIDEGSWRVSNGRYQCYKNGKS